MKILILYLVAQVECGKGVARAIKDGLVKREELFIVSKLWNSFHDEERVKPIAKKQLADWGLEYFDLYVGDKRTYCAPHMVATAAAQRTGDRIQLIIGIHM